MTRLALLVLLAGILPAQEFPRHSFNVGGGFTEPLNGAGRRLDRGYNIGAGGGINLRENFGVAFEFNYNAFSVNAGTLSALAVPEAKARLWSLTANPILHLNPRGPVDVYLIGGGGLYHRSQEFAQPVSSSVYAPGINGGVGLGVRPLVACQSLRRGALPPDVHRWPQHRSVAGHLRLPVVIASVGRVRVAHRGPGLHLRRRRPARG